MKKVDLIRLVAAESEVTQANVVAVIDKLYDIVVEELTESKSIRVHPFGVFKLLDVAARQGRNPHTGEKIDVPAKTRVKFSPSVEFKRKFMNGVEQS